MPSNDIINDPMHVLSSVPTSRARLFEAAVLLSAFALGFAVMAFEMLASRYLNPIFGSGITTWAGLISTVLAAMMIGYLAGGHLADRMPRPAVPGVLVVLAAFYLFVFPPRVGPWFSWLVERSEEGAAGILAASGILLFLPIMLISAFYPFAIRLLLRDSGHGGRVSGHVYGISAIGNIAGTLTTTFLLMPIFGTRVLALAVAALVGAVGLLLVVLDRRA